MKPWMKLATAALMLATLPECAAAGEIAKIGAWTAYRNDSNSNGRQMCGVYTRGDNGRTLHIKYEGGHPYFYFMMWKQSWRIPPKTEVEVGIGFDQTEVVWTGPGYGQPTTEPRLRAALGDAIVVEVSDKITKEFFQLFRASVKMRVTFLTGSEGPWVANMNGSDAIADVFANCLKTIAAPTQPHDSKAKPTQPYSPNQPTTQPFDAKPSQPKVKEESI